MLERALEPAPCMWVSGPGSKSETGDRRSLVVSIYLSMHASIYLCKVDGCKVDGCKVDGCKVDGCKVSRLPGRPVQSEGGRGWREGRGDEVRWDCSGVQFSLYP